MVVEHARAMHTPPHASHQLLSLRVLILHQCAIPEELGVGIGGVGGQPGRVRMMVGDERRAFSCYCAADPLVPGWQALLHRA